ncbi:MAG TPA: YbdK family carboxylate-amine ligase [Homoserinimonas sp.]|nr:YbdK family carboxylate-amine ligase [Homoserinimonas sp.]
METFGIEEEYVFLEPVTLEPRSVANEVYRSLGISRVESPQVQREYLVCQLERTTPVCETLDEAVRDLRDFRRRLGAAAESHGVLVAGTGTPPRMAGPGVVTDKRRYHAVSNNYRALVRQHFLNGLHVHVGIPNREIGVQAMNRMRRWMPVIVALGGNSPFWENLDTGFTSWRTINLQRWTTHGCPPVFADAADYERRTTRLLGIGGHVERALLAWNIRLSEVHPTIEVRAPDSQLEAWHSVLLAAIIRGLVVTAEGGEASGPDPEPELLNASLWHAARDGIGDHLVHPDTGEMMPARKVIDDLIALIRGALMEHGDLETVVGWLERLFAEGTGADRQRAAFVAGGLPAVAAVLHDTIAG